MCTEANVVRNGDVTECETVGQLAAALGIGIGEVPMSRLCDFVVEADDCLCSVQWDKLPARRATDAEGWPFPEYIVEPDNDQVQP